MGRLVGGWVRRSVDWFATSVEEEKELHRSLLQFLFIRCKT